MLLSHMSAIRIFRAIVNALGIAWWARVETKQPSCTYWFGPFLTRKSLKNHLSTFEQDLSGEGAHLISQRHFRCRRSEPLTILF